MDDFPFEIKRDIRMLPVTVNVLGKGVPDDVKYILFKRLNTGGIKLSPQEIRNAVYWGDTINIIREMADFPAFKAATLNAIPTLRKQDMDFVSRFVAFYLIGYENYTEPDLDKFINTCMSNIKKGMYDNKIESMKQNFIKAMNLAAEIFGDDAFRKRTDKASTRNPLNKAYFEVISVAFAKLSDENTRKLLLHKELFKDNLIKEMKENSSYFGAFSGGTAKTESVKKRFSVFNDILLKSINDIKI